MKEKNTIQNALISIPKNRLLLVLEQDSSLRNRVLIYEACVDKINEGTVRYETFKLYRVILGLYHTYKKLMI
jgi:hypothetical protein